MKEIILAIDISPPQLYGEKIFIDNNLIKEANSKGFILTNTSVMDELIWTIKYAFEKAENSNLDRIIILGPCPDFTYFELYISLIHGSSKMKLINIYCPLLDANLLKDYRHQWENSNLSNWVEVPPFLNEMGAYRKNGMYAAMQLFSEKNNIEFEFLTQTK